MDKKALLLRHLSTSMMIVIYVLIVTIHLISDSFVLSSQIGVLMMMLPFVLYSAILDFILKRNTTLDPVFKIITQLLPCSIFILQIISTILLINGKAQNDIIDCSIWFFLSLPFFIASYEKTNFKKDIINAIVASGIVVVIYSYLSISTDNLYKGSGSSLYFISYVFMFYTASRIKKHIGIMLGALNAIMLLLIRFVPFTQEAKLYGWDYNMIMHFETLLLITLIISILLRIIAVYKNEVSNKNQA